MVWYNCRRPDEPPRWIREQPRPVVLLLVDGNRKAACRAGPCASRSPGAGQLVGPGDRALGARLIEHLGVLLPFPR